MITKIYLLCFILIGIIVFFLAGVLLNYCFCKQDLKQESNSFFKNFTVENYGYEDYYEFTVASLSIHCKAFLKQLFK